MQGRWPLWPLHWPRRV